MCERIRQQPQMWQWATIVGLCGHLPAVMVGQGGRISTMHDNPKPQEMGGGRDATYIFLAQKNFNLTILITSPFLILPSRAASPPGTTYGVRKQDQVNASHTNHKCHKKHTINVCVCVCVCVHVCVSLSAKPL